MNCDDCRHNPRDWRLCLHPESATKGFWDDPQDYSCKSVQPIALPPGHYPDSLETPCEGCDAPATTSDSEGVPLCVACYDSIPPAQ